MIVLAGAPRITPFLWFNNNAAEAAEFYVSVFPNSRMVGELRNPGPAPLEKGAILTVTFELDGVKFTAMNGGPGHNFTDAISFVIRCESQEEVDYYWSRLTAGGQEVACGWLRDKFGLSWQVIPERLPELVKNAKAMQAMMKMKKLDITELERAVKD